MLINYIKKKGVPSVSPPAKKEIKKSHGNRLPGRGNFNIVEKKGLPLVEVDARGDVSSLRIFFDYDDKRIAGDNPEELIYSGTKETGRRANSALKRDMVFERETITQLSELFARDICDSQSGRRINFILNLDLRNLLKRYGDELKKSGISVKIKGSSIKIEHFGGSLSISSARRENWFDITVRCDAGQGRVLDISDDGRLLDRGLVNTPGGLVLLDEEDAVLMRHLAASGMEGGSLTASRYDLNLLNDLEHQGAGIKGFGDFLRISEKLNLPGEFDSPPSSLFNGTLRGYQQEGYRWLNFLRENELSGCLADDMGLGKTVQVIALLAELKKRKLPGPCLIVLPVVTLSNWERELEKFAPSLKVIRHGGKGRDFKPADCSDVDVVLVSYQKLRNDILIFGAVKFFYIILDEAQNIKNPLSKTFRALKRLRSVHRLALTGTPVENSLSDLWAVMDFLNPGLLGDLSKFKDRFNPDYSESVKKLSLMVSPFILRRKKEDVLPELPPLEESVLYVEMGQKQRDVYDSYLQRVRESLETAMKEKGNGRASMDVLSALLRLRQICLFPELADEKFSGSGSCKLKTLNLMLDQILPEGHRVLIFSQFVQSLNLIKLSLEERKINYAYINGSTKDRGAEIDRFQNQKDVKVFLLSLKAGGVGVNLTGADYVFLFDPWWNPAVESQAIDRSHRMGQEEKVVAYRMIVRDSVEEKVVKLQNRKRHMAEYILSSSSSVLKSLSDDEVMELFR